MKNLLLLISLFVFSNNSVAQVPYTPFEFDENVWEESYYGLWSVIANYEVVQVGDTVINNQTFFKLHKYGMEYYYDDINQIEIVDSLEIDRYEGAIRENNQKQIEFIYPGYNTSIILFDFNIEVGDTIQLYDLGMASHLNAKVYSLDTIDVCGSLRNRYNLYFYEYGFMPGYLIDGVGGSGGILPTYEVFESGSTLICYSDRHCECFESVVNTQVLEKEQIQINIFPNPVTENELTILSDTGLTFEIEAYNAFGKRMDLKTSEGAAHFISTSNWPPGCYYLKIKKDGSQSIEKVIVQ